jgi:N4-(beta-N-acetylglucosaminyl)-L-asparaginase
MKRRDFVRTAACGAGAAGVLAAGPSALAASEHRAPERRAPEVLTRRAVRPVVVSDLSGIRYRNGGPENAVERAFRGITSGEDVLDALVAGVNIPELDPDESGIGYGGLPNAEGVVQLDSCCMHGPRKWAGGVAGIEGVRTPSLVAKAVAEFTDHHLIGGEGAREFARALGFTIEDDLNTERSRALWLDWRRRVDPDHWLDPEARLRRGGGEREAALSPVQMRARGRAWLRAGLDMVDEGLIPAHSFWGTINCDGIGPEGDLGGVTTTSGLAWKIPGRIGDSPILGAGLYVDNEVGAAGSTGRGEANLYNLSSALIVEFMRQGMAPKDAGLAVLERVRANTIEPRLLDENGFPSFDLRFFILNKQGQYAGVALRGTGDDGRFAVCDENGAREESFEVLMEA